MKPALKLVQPPRPEPWEDMPPNKHTGLPMVPRRWQAEALPKIGAALRAGERPVVVACTGAGKAVLLTEMVRLIEWSCTADEVVVVSAPTVALVGQLSEDLGSRCRSVGVYYGKAKRIDATVIVVCNASALRLAAALAVAGRAVKFWLADEAHKTETKVMRDAIEATSPRLLAGMTATPFRSTGCTHLQLFSTVAERYLMADAIAEGVLVPYKPFWPKEDSDDRDEACLRLILRHTSGPGVVGANTIVDAEAHAEWLTARGVPAEAIHSQLTEEERADRIEALRSGRLRCVVHVAMLIEGVDYPWLRWLCLRRAIGSMVALIQQLGRVLRSYPGKSEAIVLDPHQLLETFGLTLPENIGAAEEKAADELEDKPERDGPGEREGKEPTKIRAVAEATQWARRALLALMFSGAIPDAKIKGSRWRSEPPTAPQLRSLAKMHKAWARYLPPELQPAVAKMARGYREELTRGAVSDVLGILHAVAAQAPEGGWQARQRWRGPTWPEELELPKPPEWMR
jgi:hypothetical protein